MTSATLGEIAAILDVPAPAEADRRIAGLATLDVAGPDEVSFLGSEAYLKQFANTRAAAVIVQKRIKLPKTLPAIPLLIVDDADLAMSKVLERFAPPVPRPAAGVDPTATIADSARLGDGCAIGPRVFIGERTVLGRNCIIHPGVYIGDDVTLGDGCVMFPNVVIRERITIGRRVTIHAGSVLGTDGFGYRWNGQQHEKVPQIGTVIIEDDVEIGSCVCIDRAKFSSTRVGMGTKIDNLVQIGHNVQIGSHCIIVAQVGIAGSSTLGRGVVLGGQTAVRDHITIGDGAMAAARSGIAEDVEPKMVVSGAPALPHRQSLREQAALRRLPEIVTQFRKLQEEIERVRKQFDL